MFSPTVEASASFCHLVRERRATPTFAHEHVPLEAISQALALAAQAPSGFNFQPWRFLVLTEAGQKKRLWEAANHQEKITQASAVIIAFGQRKGWQEHIDEIVRLSGARRGQDAAAQQKQKNDALAFLAHLPPAVWINRQVMIAFTHLMLAFESLGWDTAPMEGFDAASVVRAFSLPDDAEVVALLAVGRARDAHIPHPGRLEVSRIAFLDHLVVPFPSLP